MYIGKQLKQIRKTKHMTLQELSAKSKVQVATLSRMENSKMTGTLESHMDIAKALGVNVTALYSDIIKEDTNITIKNGSPSTDVFVHNNAASSEMLTSQIMLKKMSLS